MYLRFFYIFYLVTIQSGQPPKPKLIVRTEIQLSRTTIKTLPWKCMGIAKGL